MNPDPPTSSAPRERLGQSTRIFLDHLKHHLLSLPFVTTAALIAPIVVAVLDLVGHLITGTGWISHFCSLYVSPVIHSGQVQRLVLYPLARPSLSLTFTNLLLLVPFLSAMEKKKGSLSILWFCFTLFTIIPAIIYVIVVALYAYSARMPEHLARYGCAGTSGWVVALAVWSTLEDEQEDNLQDRMLFGAIRLPAKIIPGLIILFYFFLVPDTSLLLHLSNAGIAYLLAMKRLPPFLVLSAETCRRYEENGMMNRFVHCRGYISVDGSEQSGYLPISTTSSTMPGTSSSGQNASTSPSFPGAGRRLGE
ncbi:uncharacterized protein BYT42DRAFT_610790 [Radiomyces spectabilis]|uniref:uncharacterized protein n=1 Tax=Radiomyces spectabilis TaxID=64574 RepID=UPI00221F53EB|nr:uncharacterized protein BYT42DRAFT_610790 [Radiomyces spectabilis]KAI8391581.1 hypothetical protein BYT42DRAFT_610790 [Radiomyces spectabilis]